MFDSKKLKMVFTQESGDVDLLGHESGKTLAEKKAEVQNYRQEVNSIASKLSCLHTPPSA